MIGFLKKIRFYLKDKKTVYQINSKEDTDLLYSSLEKENILELIQNLTGEQLIIQNYLYFKSQQKKIFFN